MVAAKKTGRNPLGERGDGNGVGDGGGGLSHTGYEQSREKRIKENMERMQKLGILDLSKKLKAEIAPPRKPSVKKIKDPETVSEPSRRSSRLKTLAPVSYVEKAPKRDKPAKSVEIHIENGSEPEVYTEEHLELLGDSKSSWTVGVDGYDEDGTRMYDSFVGETCHQCRQKTLGHHTHCSKCKIGLGQLCGDCLYTRYGEHVLEVEENPNWVCPVCRGICNCSRCRKSKGWNPTGLIYRKVATLGFKSVAHYLIQTRQFSNIENRGTEDLVLAEISVPSNDESPGIAQRSGSDETGYDDEMDSDGSA